MLDGRKRISVIAACGIATLGGSLLVAAPSSAEPDIEEVQARVERLYHEAEQASERFNDARVELERTQARLKSLRADLERQEQKVEDVRARVASTVVAQYQGQALSTTSQVFLSEDPDAFLDQLQTVTAYNDQQGQLMAEFANQIKRLELREAAAKREFAGLARTKEKLAKEKAEIDDKAGKAKSLLDELEAEARAAARPSRSSARPAMTNVAVSGRAGAAVNYALAQVGDAYVYGASGPDAFDCSGLTMMAWAQAGVSLPHSSSAQMSSGPSVSSDALQPGDLVFYYSPVSHVGIYIGNGQIVHAANPSTGVEVAPVFSMPFSGAVRPG
ncbi:MAG TPA: NlpC/P60 family protein [Nocardioidaceae bacterium]|nr:NlpC/P60 family protein [Nocardioidaceae bacterium]